MSKKSFVNIVKVSLYDFKNAFDIFEISFGKVFFYFIMLNIMMLFPITWSITQMDSFDFERFGFNVTTTEIPDWIPSGLPTSCKVDNNQLDCGIIDIFDYEIETNGSRYTIYLNVPSNQVIDEDKVVIFYQDRIGVQMNGSVLNLSYVGYEGLDFNDLHSMTQEEAAEIMFQGFFNSVKPVVLLPIILVAISALFVANLFLVTMLAALSMLFKLGRGDYPCYSNMVKLMMIASTIPAIINIFLGFAGLVAFTSLSYNFITPVIALVMFKAGERNKLLEE